MTVRPAEPDERPAVLNVLDGAALATDATRVGAALAAGDVLVAHDGGPLLGALVLRGDEIDAVAVRRRRRGQGLGTALVERAADRRERLVATFARRLRPFYAGLGFAVGPAAEPGRLRGVLDPARLR